MKAQELIHDTRVESAPASAFDRPAWVQRGDRNLIVLSLVLIVTIRFFTEVRPVLPRAANFIDVPLFVILFFRYALTPRAPRGTRRWFSLAAGLFIAVWLLSSLVNTGRVAVGPGVLFLYGFLGDRKSVV